VVPVDFPIFSGDIPTVAVDPAKQAGASNLSCDSPLLLPCAGRPTCRNDLSGCNKS
jgi:hypothetical protein